MDDRTRLSRASQLKESGRLDEAIDLAEPVTDRYPGDIQIQMMVGMWARAADRFDLAMRCFERAAQHRPHDPQIANIRANTLAAAGRSGDALRAFADLLRQFPGFFDGHLNQAITAFETRAENALDLVERSLEVFPGKARLLSIKGEILRSHELLEDAIVAQQAAVAAEPDRALHHLRLGITLRATGREPEALLAYARARSLGHVDPAVDSLEAAARLELGQLDEAEALYLRAFKGGDPEAGAALQRLRREYRGEDDAASHWAEAARDSQNPEVWLRWLSALAGFNDAARLARASSEMLRHFPSDPRAKAFAARAKAAAGDAAGAYSDLRDLAGALPEEWNVERELALLALAQNDSKLAALHAGAVLVRDPFDQAALAYLSTAWRLSGDPREEWLCDYEKMVVPVEIAGPAGEAPRDFAREVATVLEPLHRTVLAPGDQSLRGGTQTSGKLFARPGAEIAAFKDAVLEAAHRVIAGLPTYPDHPFYGRKRAGIAFSGSWSVRLQGGGGHHVSHFHSQGWISSAYYARLPETIGAADGDRAGWIAFGAPPASLGLDLPPRRYVQPREGLLVLFPSYMWHGTVEFAGAAPRLTAAFDIVPVA